MPLSRARSDTFWPVPRSSRSALGAIPSTSASDSKSARAIARRSVLWSVAGAVVVADGFGLGVGLAAWASPPARPRLRRAAAPPLLTVLTASAANGFIGHTSFVLWIRRRIGHHDEAAVSEVDCGAV